MQVICCDESLEWITLIVKEEKDLGVIIDNQLKFHTHTSAPVKKANSILGLIKRSFVALDEDTLPVLFTSMVRPHLEYANIIWGPHFIGDVRSVERVQKRATKLVPLLRNVPYRERLKNLKLPSLEHRRKRGDMITCYKIVTGKVNVGLDNFFLLNKRNTRVHNLKILKSQQATKQVRQLSFPCERSTYGMDYHRPWCIQIQSTNSKIP